MAPKRYVAEGRSNNEYHSVEKRNEKVAKM